VGTPAALDGSLLQGIQVLVVDDDADARELLHAVLEYCGAQVLAAPSTRRALATLEHTRPHVILCDLVMPGEDGYTFVRAIRSHTTFRRVPVIALTAYGFDHAAEEALAAGFNAYLRKPVEPWKLCGTIARLK
jgi:CheY-like chemotaxis protein